MTHSARTRLREVIGDYDHAADTDGDHFSAAADILTTILRTYTSRDDLLAAINAAITATADPAVLSLLHNARTRVAGDLVDVGRRANDTLNARTAHSRKSA